MDATLKKKFPFRLGTTSFIYRADYVTNVRRLAPFFDEIELLLLESSGLPSKDEIKTLCALAAEHDITYNVHLPMDIDPAAVSTQVRWQSIEKLANTMDRVAPLNPTTQTLHIAFDQPHQTEDTVQAWQKRAIHSLNKLLQVSGVAPGNISIENLDFSPLWLRPIVESMDTAVCVDVGHAVLFGFNLKKTLDLYAPRITLIHLHGIAQGKDHRALTQLAPAHGQTVAKYLNGFQESVSLEVFSLENLTESMARFPEFMALAKNEDPA